MPVNHRPFVAAADLAVTLVAGCSAGLETDRSSTSSEQSSVTSTAHVVFLQLPAR